jgi:hypothetical protein
MLKHLSKEELKCIRDYIKEYKNIKDEAKIKLNQLVEENEKLNDLSY